MAYHTTDGNGVTLINPTYEQMKEILASLDEEENDNPDISLTHDSGWTLTAFSSGILVWENYNDDEGETLYMRNITRNECLNLWQLLAKGNIQAIARKPWQTDPS